VTLGELLERTSRDLPDNWQISVDFYGGGGCEVTLIDPDGDRVGYDELMECGSPEESIDLAISIARREA